MYSSVILVLIGIVGLVAVTQATDYCAKSLCGDKKHIACDNSGKFAKTCSADRKLVNMTAALKTAIVKRHNQLRNTLASGKLAGFQPSPRMATMQWDDDLAANAVLNVKTCKFEHDACHNTVKYPQSGQNLAAVYSNEEFTTSVEETTLPLIDSWWSEKANTTMKEINRYPEHFEAVIGHFTVIAVDSNYRVGCAISTYREPQLDNWYAFLFACNYARTNVVNRTIYTSGKTASKCKTGPNPKFKGLCSEKEQY